MHNAAKPVRSGLGRRVQVLRRYDEDRNNPLALWLGTDPSQRLDPVEIGHREVHQDEVEVLAAGNFYGFQAASGADDPETRVTQDGREDRPVVGIIVSDQHEWPVRADVGTHSRARHTAEAKVIQGKELHIKGNAIRAPPHHQDRRRDVRVRPLNHVQRRWDGPGAGARPESAGWPVIGRGW